MPYGFREQGSPVVNQESCIGCGDCARICPDENLAMMDGKAVVKKGVFLGCIACGHCMAVCPAGSVVVSGRDLSPKDRMELAPRERRATAEQFESLVYARRSVRRFTPKEVTHEVLERVIRMVSAAPMGIPPSDIGTVVLESREQVQEFAADACRCFAKIRRLFNPIVLLAMRPFMGKSRYEVFRDFIAPLLELLPAMRAQGRDTFTYDAPAAIVFHHGRMADAADCGIAATYAMLAAEALGLGSCMLGTSAALSNDKLFKAKYGIPAENKIGVTLVLGYPDVEFRYGIRRRLASVRYGIGGAAHVIRSTGNGGRSFSALKRCVGW